MSVSIIIGNGRSRENIELQSLVGQGTIFGCNALYRSFDGWDYLVAIDDEMIAEIQTTEKMLPGKLLIPIEDERWESAEYSQHRRRSNAGMNAMLEAIRRDSDILYCLGFDFLLKGDQSTSNVFEGTSNYGPNRRANLADNYWRLKYLDWFCCQHQEVKFIFVFPNPEEIVNFGFTSKNIFMMSSEKFLSKLS